jgi:hypothetical protein
MHMSNTLNPDAFSVGEFAERHGIGRTTAFAEIKAGRLEARKVASRTIITREAAAAWRNSLPKITSAAA